MNSPSLPFSVPRPFRAMLRRRFLLDGPDRIGGPADLVRATGKSRTSVHRWFTPEDADAVDPDVADVIRLVAIYPQLREEVREIMCGPDEDLDEVRRQVAEAKAALARVEAIVGVEA
jgi:hypothetical protein